MAPPRKKPAPVTLRGMMSQVAGEQATLERIREIAMDALNVEAGTEVTCPDCGSRFRARVADEKKRLDAAVTLVEQLEGKAGDQPPGALTVVVERAAR